MKKFKFFVLMTFFVAIIFCANSCEQDDPDLENLLRDLKLNLPVFKTDLLPNGRDLPENKDFRQIERAIFNCSSGYRFPKTLESFYKEVGNRDFPGIYLCPPNGGLNSKLYNLIREGQEKKIPNEWLAFTKFAGNEYFCINHKTGVVCLYIVFPEFYMDEITYPNLSSWIKKVALAS